MRNKFQIEGDITRVFYKDKEFIIDTDDLSLISGHTWNIDKRNYVQSRINTKCVSLQSFLMGTNGNGMKVHVDHIDRNPLNNRRCNLRVCTPSQNLYNQKKRSNNKSGTVGVCFDKKHCHRFKPWASYITVNKKPIFLGHSATLEEAIKKRKEAEMKYFGEYRLD